MASADYLGEDVVLVHPDGREQVLEARFDPTEVLLSVTPTEPLVAGGAYVVRWPSLRGLNAATPGYGDEAHFTAGTADDTASPTLRGRHRTTRGTSSASRTIARTSSRNATSSTSRSATPATTAAATG